MDENTSDRDLWNDFRRYFDAFVVEDVRKSLTARLEVGTIILTTAGIEALSGYFAGQQADREVFTTFIRRFMPNYADFAAEIYACIRNGLAHDYVIKRSSDTGRTFVLQRDHGEPHLTASSSDPSLIHFNREDYANDFLRAQKDYFDLAEHDTAVWQLAIKRLGSQKGYLTVKPIGVFARLIETQPREPDSGASAIGLSTGSHTDPRWKP